LDSQVIIEGLLETSQILLGNTLVEISLVKTLNTNNNVEEFKKE